MSFLAAIPIVGKVVEKALGIVDSLVEDKDKANEIKAAIQSEMMNLDLKEMQTQASVILGEIRGESWLQRNWRPILMLACIAIVVNNYILFPYLSMFTDKVLILELPQWLFDLMKIGVGGYVVGRSVEKGIDKWKNGG